MLKLATDKIIYSITVLGIVVLFTAPPLWAADLQIEDHNRLVRVLADVKQSQKVEVILSASPKSISLENLDGLQQKIQAGKIDDMHFVFDPVQPGNWRIRVKPKDVTVLEISVADH